MDRDKISKTIAGILKMLVNATQQDRIDFDEDLAHEQILSLLAPVFEKAEKATGVCIWTPDRYNDGVWWTGCGKLAVYADGYTTEENPYCPKCGRNVEVPDGN